MCTRLSLGVFSVVYVSSNVDEPEGSLDFPSSSLVLIYVNGHTHVESAVVLVRTMHIEIAPCEARSVQVSVEGGVSTTLSFMIFHIAHVRRESMYMSRLGAHSRHCDAQPTLCQQTHENHATHLGLSARNWCRFA